MTGAAEIYKSMVDAVNTQDQRIAGGAVNDDVWTGALAERFRFDPHREPDPLLRVLIDYVRADDVIVDVGGGAGRLGLPLALRSRELISVDPSDGMKRIFDGVAAEAGIRNARYVQSAWLETDGIVGDVLLVSHVTYFVADIVPFIEKLQAASRRRVLIVIGAAPPPNAQADIFEAIYQEPRALVPGHRELLPVLWDMGVLPEIRVLPAPPIGLMRTFTTRQEAIEASSTAGSLPPAHKDRAVGTLEAHFDDFFVETDGGFRRRRQVDLRQLVITWETAAI